jgi:hypothetical protein
MVGELPFSLGGTWWFRLGHDPAWSSPFREKTNWQGIAVPGPWERQGFSSYNGHAWYRLSFLLPSKFASESLGIDLGYLGDADEVFLNGQRIGATGGFPPLYQSAVLQRRIYRLPRASLRFGEFNELAVHVYNGGRFGGFLGPAPKLDRYERLLRQQQGRDLALWVTSAVLVVVGLFHGFLALRFGGGREQWPWVAFLVSLASYQLTYASLGPSLLFSPGTNFRLNVVLLLLSVGLFPLVLYALAGQGVPGWAVVFAATLAVGAGFALVWRQTPQLYFWVYLAEVGVVLLVFLGLAKFFLALRRGQATSWLLAATALVFFLAALGDVAVDLALLPRPELPGLTLYSSPASIPFAFIVSLVLTLRWARHHAASLLPPMGLLPLSVFLEEIRQRMAASPKPAFAVALLRLSTAAGTPVDLETVLTDVRRHVRHCDLLARFSRETLALLLEESVEREALSQLERLRRALRQRPGSLLLRPTAGLAAYNPARHATAEELLKAAEAALYAARSEGGDCTATAP